MESEYSFESLLKDVRNVFEYGSPSGEKANLKEIVLQGMKARGAAYRLQKALDDEYEIIHITSPDQKIKTSKKWKKILYLDLGNFEEVPSYVKKFADERKNTKIMIVDIEGKHKKVKDYSWSAAIDHCRDNPEKDVDPIISRKIMGFYLNVDFAVDEEGKKYNGKFVKPYFNTSALIDWNGSYFELKGSLESVISRKFEPEVIASRYVTGEPPNDVKMSLLGKPISEELGLETVVIKRDTKGYYLNKEDSEKVDGKRVILLEDVIGSATTKRKLVPLLRKKGANVTACVTVLDRLDGGQEALAEEEVKLYSLTNMDMYEQLKEEKEKKKECANLLNWLKKNLD